MIGNSRSEEKQFVDTNILVYAYDSTNPVKQAQAQALLHKLIDNGQGCISIQVLKEFYATMTRKLRRPFSPEEAAEILQTFEMWHIHSPTFQDILAAIDIQTRYQLSFWDALIVYSANALKCKIVWTEDLSAGQQIQQTLIQNPFD